MIEAQQRCPASEFPLWAAEFERDPWGESRIGLAIGHAFASALSLIYGKQIRGGLTPRDFMPLFEAKQPASREKIVQHFEDKKAVAKARMR